MDIVGRKNAMLYAALFTIFAAILQAASQNIAMFVIARIFIGMGTSASGTAGKRANGVLHVNIMGLM